MTLPLVVSLPDGRTFTRRAPSPQYPPQRPLTFEVWARFLAAALERAGNPMLGDSVAAITCRRAERDFARDAALGFQQWLEMGSMDGC